MKKKFILLIALIFITTGCGEIKTITCTDKVVNDDKAELEATYIIYYKGDYVTKLKATENITSDNQTLLEAYKESLNESYKKFNKLNYYSNSLSIEDNTLISSTVINYSKINYKKLKKLDQTSSKLIKNGKIKLSDMKKNYTNNGATCTK